MPVQKKSGNLLNAQCMYVYIYIYIYIYIYNSFDISQFILFLHVCMYIYIYIFVYQSYQLVSSVCLQLKIYNLYAVPGLFEREIFNKEGHILFSNLFCSERKKKSDSWLI